MAVLPARPLHDVLAGGPRETESVLQ